MIVEPHALPLHAVSEFQPSYGARAVKRGWVNNIRDGKLLQNDAGEIKW